ncbi:MAG: 30S ribosomal protein S6, partial [Bacteroidota bacterium]
MEHIQRLYETTFIINGVLEDVHIEATIAKVQDLVLKNGCEIVTLTRWGRKRFAYPIKHKNNGYYVILEFKAFPEFAKELERFY